MKRRHESIRLGEAWQGIRALIANPDDTNQVFKIIRALAGRSGERQFQRFLASPQGPTILAERRSLIGRLADRAYLGSLPEGSLGRVYLEFVEREEISADGLVEASESVPREPDEALCPDRALFGERLRDSHDLWHVVTGYGRDLFGEAALLAFTYRQTRNRGIGFIVLVAYLRAGRSFPEERRMIRDGFRRARGAAWLPGVDWESLLGRPLSEVREALRVTPVGHYPVLRSQGAPAVA